MLNAGGVRYYLSLKNPNPFLEAKKLNILIRFGIAHASTQSPIKLAQTSRSIKLNDDRLVSAMWLSMPYRRIDHLIQSKIAVTNGIMIQNNTM